MLSTILVVIFLFPQYSICMSGNGSGCSYNDELALNYHLFSVDVKNKLFKIEYDDPLMSFEKLQLNVFSNCSLQKPDYIADYTKLSFQIPFKRLVKENSCFSVTYDNTFPGECSPLRYNLHQLTKPGAITTSHLRPGGDAYIQIPNDEAQFVFPANGEFNDDCICSTNELHQGTCQCLNNTGYFISVNDTLVYLKETKDSLNNTSIYLQKVENCTDKNCNMISILQGYNFQFLSTVCGNIGVHFSTDSRQFSFQYSEILLEKKYINIAWNRATNCEQPVSYYLVEDDVFHNNRSLNNQAYTSINRTEMNTMRYYVEARIGGTVCSSSRTSLEIPDNVETTMVEVILNEDICITPNILSATLLLPMDNNGEVENYCYCDGDLSNINTCSCIRDITSYRIYNNNNQMCFSNITNNTTIHIVYHHQNSNENISHGTYPLVNERFNESYRFLVVDPGITTETPTPMEFTTTADSTTLPETPTVVNPTNDYSSETSSVDSTTDSSALLLPTPVSIAAGAIFSILLGLTYL